MAAFWGGDDKVLLAPAGTDRAWLEDVEDQMRCRIQLVEPAQRPGLVLGDTLASPGDLARLVDALDDEVRIEPWGTTPEVLQLDSALQAHGIVTRRTGPDAEDLWTVGYLDSKLALQDLASRIQGLRVPRSHVALSYEHLVGLAEMMVARHHSFVVKSNVGVGGFGTFIAADVSKDSVIEDLFAAMDDEPVFREGPFLVQDYVESAPNALKPTYDGIVHGSDTVETVGVGGMVIDGATYRGVAVGEIPLPVPVLAEAEAVGRAIGRFAGQLGYRGWFDVDFVLAEEGHLFATEINARRTSPAHAFHALERWSAADPELRCVIADDHVPVPSGFTSWACVEPAIEAIRGGGIRCAATIVRSLRSDRPTLGVIVGGADHAEASEAHAEIVRRLNPVRTERPVIRQAG